MRSPGLLVRPFVSRRRMVCVAAVAFTLVTSGGCGDDPLAGDEPDLGCTEEDLSGGDDEFRFSAAYEIVDGALGSLCLGREDERLLDAWDTLATIAPAGQLADIGIFSGFTADAGEADTLAFVSPLDPSGVDFQMAINLDEADSDPDELLLTLAHEFTHVFTATAPELDRTAEAIESCTTYDNGDGCYAESSLMTAWIAEFWPPELLDSVDPFDDDPDAADDRCVLDDGFFGAYAATNPEEDFAEAFSAYVFGLTPMTDGQQARLDWIDARPGLVEFRDRADAAGLTPLENRFDVCG